MLRGESVLIICILELLFSWCACVYVLQCSASHPGAQWSFFGLTRVVQDSIYI